MSFTVATYNILANAYIRPAWYPHTPPEMLVAAQRGPALVRHIIGLAADILCLQEVEDGMFTALEEGLRPCGYTGHLTKKARGKPDGCAIAADLAGQRGRQCDATVSKPHPGVDDRIEPLPFSLRL